MAGRKFQYVKFPTSSEELRPRQHESTCVANLKYYEDEEQVECEFMQRGTYAYFDVPPDVFAEWNNAGSRGTYFDMYIKGHYEYERIA